MIALHKICEIYVTPPNDTKKVIEQFKETDYYISCGYDESGHFKYEIFEKEEE